MRLNSRTGQEGPPVSSLNSAKSMITSSNR